MKSLVLKVAGYLFLRYLIYLLVIYATNKDAKFINSTDLQSGQDWFYFIWLFGIPLVIEFIIIGIPLFYGVEKIDRTTNNKYIFYLLFISLFGIEFLISNWIYGSQTTSILKISISIPLFVVYFWKRLF